MADQQRDEPAVERFVERFASDLVEAGMPRMPARVFGALLASETGSLASAELGDRLKVSPAAVSGAVRYLAHIGMISREREPGSRRERYTMHIEQWYESFGQREQIMSRWENTLRAGAETVGRASAAGERISETADFFAFVQREIGQVIERWRAHRAQEPAAD